MGPNPPRAGLRWLLYCLVVFCVLTISVKCTAGLVGFQTWTEEFKDGNYILVMIPSDEEFQQEWDGVSEKPNDDGWKLHEDAIEARELRAKYPVSGLYKNDGTYSLVWEFSNWTYHDTVYLSKNGRYVVFAGTWSTDWVNLSDPGWRADIADFVVDGEIVASYNYAEQIRFPLFKAILTQQHIRCAKQEFDPNALTYTVATNWGEEIVFDVTSGKIISHYRPLEILFLVLLALFFSFVATVFLYKNRRRHPEPTEPRQ